jgi:hypothetical protein
MNDFGNYLESKRIVSKKHVKISCVPKIYLKNRST